MDLVIGKILSNYRIKMKINAEQEYKEKMSTEYIGLKYQNKSQALITLLQQDNEDNKLNYWLQIEDLLDEYRNYKTTFESEIVFFLLSNL